jgi:hypothetical protein
MYTCTPMSVPTTVHELKTLILSFHPLIVFETVEEQRVESLLVSATSDLRLPLLDWTITRGLCRFGQSTPMDGTTAPIDLLRKMESMMIEAAYHLKDFSQHLSDPAVRRALRDVSQKFSGTRSVIILTGDPVELPSELEHKAVRVTLELPGRDELRGVVRAVLQSLEARQRVSVDLNAGEMDQILRALTGLTLNQARQAVAQAVLDDGKLSRSDVAGILRRKSQIVQESGLLEFYPFEDNQFELGGFGRLKAWLDQARVGFSPMARQMNLRPPRGVLLVGVQGCGKSLAARFIAREWRLPLLKLDAGRLYDKYVGESEKNFRKATSLAAAMAPVVLWIDEIEKAFAQSGGDSDGGLSRRMFGTFLTWLQEKRQEVFVVGAANDLMSLPPELLRKGRFDEIFFVDLPTDEERRAIFSIHFGLRRQDPAQFDLAELSRLTEGFSGAEIEQVVVSALYRSLYEKRLPADDLVRQEIEGTVPLSVSRREDIERLRESARGRFTPVR